MALSMGLVAAVQLHLSGNPNTLLPQASCCASVAYRQQATAADNSNAVSCTDRFVRSAIGETQASRLRQMISAM